MICLDSSVVVKLALDEEHSDVVEALYSSLLATQQTIIAPSLLPLEFTNIMRKQMRGPSGLSLIQATILLEDLLDLQIEIHDPPGLHVTALTIADEFGLPATYDAHYLALSDLMGCEFWTADRRLWRQVERGLPFVRWIADFREQ